MRNSQFVKSKEPPKCGIAYHKYGYFLREYVQLQADRNPRDSHGGLVTMKTLQNYSETHA